MPRGVSLDLILETPLGPVGLLMLPLTTTQVTPGEPSLLPNLLEGIQHASECGARCVALTGLIPSATQHGAARARGLRRPERSGGADDRPRHDGGRGCPESVGAAACSGRARSTTKR